MRDIGNPDIVQFIQASSTHIQAHSEPCATRGYAEIWYIQSP